MSCRFTLLARLDRVVRSYTFARDVFKPRTNPVLAPRPKPAPTQVTAKLSCALLLAITPALASAKLATEQTAPTQPAQDPITTIYQQDHEALLWSAFGHPKELAYTAIELLASAGEHGLNPERYATSLLYSRIDQIASDADLAAFDRLLTAAIWSFNEDLRLGNQHQTTRQATPAHTDTQALTALVNAIKQDKLSAHLDAHSPRFASYQQLQEALATYRDYQLMDGWSALPTDLRLTLGERHAAVPALRQRLAMTDALAEDAISSTEFDAQLQAAVMRFQARHQLQTDGEVGPATLAQLNVPVEDKIRALQLNLARLRALPDELPADRIQVNIPEFELRLYRDDIETLNMNVVVGSKRNPTPPMQDRLRHLVFNPYWYPTRNITVNEILPRLKRDPGYLQRSRFELLKRGSKTVVNSESINWQEVEARNFPYRFRQTPGAKNSLGKVKFIFPNKQSIYLHDTPSRSLFSKRVRAFSHGCVRVEKPTELATELMAWDRGWTRAEVLADIGKAKRKLRKFKREMDNYLLYQTVAIRGEPVNFFPDIYRHDRRQQTATAFAPAVAALAPNRDVERTSRSIASR